MLSASEQLRHFEERLLQTGGLLRPNVRARTTRLDRRADFAGVLDFPGGFELYVQVLIDARPGYPAWTRYAFHLRGPDGNCVFRYDNESHYPAMSTFPHHKHVGTEETPVETHQPTLAQIVTEVRAAVLGE